MRVTKETASPSGPESSITLFLVITVLHLCEPVCLVFQMIRTLIEVIHLKVMGDNMKVLDNIALCVHTGMCVGSDV